MLVISPSERLDDIAARHLTSLPLPIRALLGGLGVSGQGDDARGAALASYLLFEAPYTRELIALGVKDTMARVDEVRTLLRLERSEDADGRVVLTRDGADRSTRRHVGQRRRQWRRPGRATYFLLRWRRLGALAALSAFCCAGLRRCRFDAAEFLRPP